MSTKTLGVVAALGLAALAGSANAGVKYSWWVNGFGYAQLDYTLTCADGTVIIRTVNGFGISGSDACSDGSNSLSWEFGAFWRRDIRAVDRKRAMSTAHVSGIAERAPALMFDRGLIEAPSPSWSGEYAVVRADPSRLPQFPDGPVSVSTMIDMGILQPSQVLFLQSFDGPFNGPFNHQVQLPPTAQDDQIFVLTFIESEPSPCQIADFNGDNVVDFFDYLDFVNAFSAEDPRSDVNRDGGIDFFDYLFFADAFSQCG
jgi:hypothetical protein